MELKMPNRNSVAYTAADYQRATMNGQRTNYEKLLEEAEQKGHGFGFVYMHAVEKATNSMQELWVKFDFVRNRGKRTSDDDQTVRMINSFESSVRSQVDSALQKYIISKNGYIDSWPISGTQDGFLVQNQTMGEKENLLLNFSYFGTDYQITGITEENGKIREVIGKRPELQYRNHFSSGNMAEYSTMMESIDKLKRVPQITKSEQRKKNNKIIFSMLPAVFLMVITLLFMFWHFADTDVEAFIDSFATLAGKGGKVVAVLALLPAFLLYFLKIIYSLIKSFPTCSTIGFRLNQAFS